MLNDHGLQQLVNEPTHTRGHILDWAVVRVDGSLLSLDAVWDTAGLSDHKGLVCTLAVPRPPPRSRMVTSRNLKAVSQPDFRSDVKAFISTAGEDLSDVLLPDLVDTYDNGLRRILDKHAPFVSRCVRDRASAPWLTEKVRDARRIRRRAERRWRKRHLTVFREIFVKERANVNVCVMRAKQQYYCESIESGSSSKQLFSVMNELLGKPKSTPLPSNISRLDLPQRFCDYFAEKIKRLRDELDSVVCDSPSFAVHNGVVLSRFEPVSEKEIYELILESPTKSCRLDPIPTSYVKLCIDELVPCITAIVNASITNGVFPKEFKHAIVTPLLKKAGLDPNELKNFRPVSNLPFVAKILEKVVQKQLLTHLSERNLLEVHQSAYRKGHSAETAVLGVLQGLYTRTDERLVSLVALLDLSAAFDTIDHSILLKRLDITFGVRGTALAWIASYVSGRSQCVLVDGSLSDPCPLLYGVPQGSVLGPILFTLYAQPLSDVIGSHGCDYHKYADDTEL